LNHLVKNPHNNRTLTLQVLNNLHAGQELVTALAQILNFADLLVQHLRSPLNVVVARFLVVDLGIDVGLPEEHEPRRDDDGTRQHDDQGSLFFGPEFFTPGPQVNACHQSKLLIARPQAIISEGASLLSADALTLEPTAMSAKGLAIMV